jgi:hypothetical protein
MKTLRKNWERIQKITFLGGKGVSGGKMLHIKKFFWGEGMGVRGLILDMGKVGWQIGGKALSGLFLNITRKNRKKTSSLS